MKGMIRMTQKHTIENFRQAVIKNIGKPICLYLKRGRKTITITNCVIKNAYQSIFMVEIEGESIINLTKLSVSYADLLTGNARITVKNDSKPA